MKNFLELCFLTRGKVVHFVNKNETKITENNIKNKMFNDSSLKNSIPFR